MDDLSLEPAQPLALLDMIILIIITYSKKREWDRKKNAMSRGLIDWLVNHTSQVFFALFWSRSIQVSVLLSLFLFHHNNLKCVPYTRVPSPEMC